MSAITEVTMSVGATLSVSTTVGGSYTALAGVTDFDAKQKRGTSDVSFLVDQIMRKKPKGRLDLGEITLNLIYGMTQYNALNGYMQAGTQIYGKITLPDASVAGPFFFHFTQQDLKVPKDDPVECAVTLDVSADPANAALLPFTPG